MHIVILHDTLPPDEQDDAAAVWQLGQGLIAAGQRVTFVTSTPGPARVENRGGIAVHLLHSRYATRWAAWYGLFNPQTVLPLTRTLRRLKPDIVHAHDVHTHLSYHSIVIGRRVGAGTVFTSRDTLPFTYGPLTYPLARAAQGCSDWDYRIPLGHNVRQAGLRWNPTRNLSIRHTMRYYTHVRIAVSAAHRQALAANRFPPFEVIYDGIDPDAVPLPAALDALRQRLRLGSRPVILLAGGPHADSRLDGEPHMLAALRRVRRRVPDAALWIWGADEERIERLRRDHPDLADALILPGHGAEGVPRATACALADVLAFPAAAFVPFPRVVLEAMAAGRAPVVSCFGGAPEAVSDGESGFAVHPHDVDALADRIARLLADADLRHRMGEAARHRVQMMFSLERHTAAMLDAYERAYVRRKGAGP